MPLPLLGQLAGLLELCWGDLVLLLSEETRLMEEERLLMLLMQPAASHHLLERDKLSSWIASRWIAEKLFPRNIKFEAREQNLSDIAFINCIHKHLYGPAECAKRLNNWSADSRRDNNLQSVF